MKPDGVVFLAILTACSHSGKVNEGLPFFESMRLDYSIEPMMKHYVLIVDMLSRAGQLDEAPSFIQNMPMESDYVIWGTLFYVCRAHKNMEMAEFASTRRLKLKPKHPGGYVFLSNVYAGVGKWDDMERVRGSMKDSDVEKGPGWSYVEVNEKLHRFVAGDHGHAQEEIMKSAKLEGCVPEMEWVLHYIEEEEKEDALGSRSEKLALAFALVSTAQKATIRIVKNLRVCGDCHSLIKHVSRISGREIVLRDIKRFYRFKDGDYSCGDYW